MNKLSPYIHKILMLTTEDLRNIIWFHMAARTERMVKYHAWKIAKGEIGDFVAYEFCCSYSVIEK